MPAPQAPRKHAAHDCGAAHVYCTATQEHALCCDAHMGIPWQFTKPGRAVLWLPFPRGRMMLRKGGSLLKVIPVQRSDGAEAFASSSLCLRGSPPRCCLAPPDSDTCRTKAPGNMGQPEMPGPVYPPIRPCGSHKGRSAVSLFGGTRVGGLLAQ